MPDPQPTPEPDFSPEAIAEGGCPDCGYTEGHTEICAGFARNDPANPGRENRPPLNYANACALLRKAEAALEAERVAHARAMVRVAHAEAMWANTEAALEASERENERLREALGMLDGWDMLTLSRKADYSEHDPYNGWIGSATSDAPWARRIIATALGTPDPTAIAAALAPSTPKGEGE